MYLPDKSTRPSKKNSRKNVKAIVKVDRGYVRVSYRKHTKPPRSGGKRGKSRIISKRSLDYIAEKLLSMDEADYFVTLKIAPPPRISLEGLSLILKALRDGISRLLRRKFSHSVYFRIFPHFGKSRHPHIHCLLWYYGEGKDKIHEQVVEALLEMLNKIAEYFESMPIYDITDIINREAYVNIVNYLCRARPEEFRNIELFRKAGILRCCYEGNRHLRPIQRKPVVLEVTVKAADFIKRNVEKYLHKAKNLTKINLRKHRFGFFLRLKYHDFENILKLILFSKDLFEPAPA